MIYSIGIVVDNECRYPAYLKIGYPGDIGYQAILFSDEKYFF